MTRPQPIKMLSNIHHLLRYQLITEVLPSISVVKYLRLGINPTSLPAYRGMECKLLHIVWQIVSSFSLLIHDFRFSSFFFFEVEAAFRGRLRSCQLDLAGWKRTPQGSRRVVFCHWGQTSLSQWAWSLHGIMAQQLDCGIFQNQGNIYQDSTNSPSS